eukprot:809217-Rhodomonas_salina.1
MIPGAVDRRGQGTCSSSKTTCRTLSTSSSAAASACECLCRGGRERSPVCVWLLAGNDSPMPIATRMQVQVQGGRAEADAVPCGHTRRHCWRPKPA